MRIMRNDEETAVEILGTSGLPLNVRVDGSLHTYGKYLGMVS